MLKLKSRIALIILLTLIFTNTHVFASEIKEAETASFASGPSLNTLVDNMSESDGVSYIYYNLGGAANNINNYGYITPKQKFMGLREPHKYGYKFDGWYLDETGRKSYQVFTGRYVFVGDSRMVGMENYVPSTDTLYIAKVGMGYDWMVSTGVPQVEDQIEDNTAVIILMGVNDLYHVNDYISYINSKAAEWGNRGAQTYFVSVGPVQNDPYCSNAEIESFNAAMQANLSGVTYIDVYSHLVSEGFSTVDGTHYPDSVSVDIYNYILDHLEEQRSGIWG